MYMCVCVCIYIHTYKSNIIQAPSTRDGARHTTQTRALLSHMRPPLTHEPSSHCAFHVRDSQAK